MKIIWVWVCIQVNGIGLCRCRFVIIFLIDFCLSQTSPCKILNYFVCSHENERVILLFVLSINWNNDMYLTFWFNVTNLISFWFKVDFFFLFIFIISFIIPRTLFPNLNPFWYSIYSIYYRLTMSLFNAPYSIFITQYRAGVHRETGLYYTIEM